MALSLKAVQADGYYMPPEYDGRKHGSLDNFHGTTGSLGKRASKQHLGILVIRFEMPYNTICLKCRRHIGQGTRFNAEKRKIGMYHSTALFEFKMTCRSCNHPFLIQNDPKNRDYAFVSGIRKKVETFTAESAETMALDGDDEKELLAKNPMMRAERKHLDERIRVRSREQVSGLLAIQRRARDDFDSNKALRRRARAQRAADAAAVAEAERLGVRDGAPLAALAPSDEREAVAAAAARAPRAGAATTLSATRRSAVEIELEERERALDHAAPGLLSMAKAGRRRRAKRAQRPPSTAHLAGIEAAAAAAAQTAAKRIRANSPTGNKVAVDISVGVAADGLGEEALVSGYGSSSDSEPDGA